MLSFHFLPVFQIMFFQQISSPKFCTRSQNRCIKTIRFVEDGGTTFDSHRQGSLKCDTIDYSYNMISHCSSFRCFASCQVAVQLSVSNMLFARKASELR
jgi:hypothetical protein